MNITSIFSHENTDSEAGSEDIPVLMNSFSSRLNIWLLTGSQGKQKIDYVFNPNSSSSVLTWLLKYLLPIEII